MNHTDYQPKITGNLPNKSCEPYILPVSENSGEPSKLKEIKTDSTSQDYHDYIIYCNLNNIHNSIMLILQ